MKFQEKKYRVDTFNDIRKKLLSAGAEESKVNQSDHYYTRQLKIDVVKLVVHGDKAKIYKLKEENGKFNLTDIIPMVSTQAGKDWLKQLGYNTVDAVKMAHTDYPYKDGTVGLYTLNNFLNSVILDYPEGRHEAIEIELGLEKAERITVPFNIYLGKIGKLETINI